VHFFYKEAPSAPAVEQTTTFTASTLALYNGKNGQPSYIAIDGIIYDVSSTFRNGTHEGYSAGKDLSAMFYTQHQKSLLSGYRVVGTYN